MDSTLLFSIIVAAAAVVGLLSASPWFVRQVAPGAVAARASLVPPRVVADAAVRLMSDARVLSDAEHRRAMLGEVANMPHPAIGAALECVVSRTSHTGLRAALGAVCGQRIAAAAELPAWVRFVVGGGRVLSPGMVAVMCLGMLIAGSAQSGVEKMLPYAGALAVAFLGCLMVKRVAGRATVAVEAYENLVFEIVLAAADAVMLAQPKTGLKIAGSEGVTASASGAAVGLPPLVIEPKEIRGRALHALHASLAATSYRRSA